MVGEREGDRLFGQILSPLSVPSLIEVLEDGSENEMVRHEAAEALGRIATDECLPVLKKWLAKEDAPKVVRESCIVAIDMWEYENSGEFQYANGLTTHQAEATPATKCLLEWIAKCIQDDVFSLIRHRSIQR